MDRFVDRDVAGLVSPSGSETIRHRADIEGLRAVAVIAVVAFHCGFSQFGGGFVGVDVFYVLSGYLITTFMVGEITATSRLSFVGFYGRRARRLLPAATLVIAATMVAGWFVLDPLSRRDLTGDALSATTYTINWRFAARSTDYFQSELAPSALQHYWSLAAEEQFYIVWPVVIAVLAGRTVRRRVLTIGVGLITAASFVVCQIVTARSQPWAFFGLHTRMWQLGLGALVAIGWTSVGRMPGRFDDSHRPPAWQQSCSRPWSSTTRPHGRGLPRWCLRSARWR